MKKIAIKANRANVTEVEPESRREETPVIVSASTLKPKIVVKSQLHPIPENDETGTNYSYTGKAIEKMYQQLKLRDSIYLRPDTYAGSAAPNEEKMWYYEDIEERMTYVNVTFTECFFKLFDEVLVNAIDQHHRLIDLAKQGVSVKPLKRISVNINEDTGVISVENDGEGLDVVIHAEKQIYIPQMIFGDLLTGTNYDDTEERTTGGRNGYGAKIANIFSKEFTLETVDSHRKLLYKQTWRNNMLEMDPPTITTYNKAPYTKITYLPDFARFNIKNPSVIGDWKLLRKRVYDAAACTDSTVSVFLNGKKLPTKSFEDYINLYIGKKSETPRVFASIGDRWQVGVCLSPEGDAEQVSFVNGICTDQGGKHVAYILDNLSKKVIERLSEKDKKSMTLKPAFIKANLFVFVKCIIVNPSFDTQTKRKLTTLVKDFGSRCDLPDDFVDKVIKLGILDRAKKLAEFKALETLGKKTDGRKSGRVFHRKLTDADPEAIRKESHKCTIVFAEGDTAISFMSAGIRGIPADEHKYWGRFPLKGKILNVRHATVKQLENNEEIMMMKKIIGLQEKVDYSIDANFKKLRYSRVVILSDADDDGHHIKGLFMNFIGHYWPSLLKREGFICEIATPIIKVKQEDSRGKVKASKEFFSTTSYKQWCDANKGGKGWTPKYYKGMGTYEPTEAVDLCKNMRLTHYCYDSTPIVYKGDERIGTDFNMELAFAKGREEDRKEWLNNGHMPCDSIPNKGKVNRVTYDSFINNKLKAFSMADNIRSIPHIMDGWKPGQRKVIYAGIKKNIKKEVKVAQVAGAIGELCEYHHGEVSLHNTIVNMAQDYVGASNITLLYPSGAYGTRKGGGGNDSKKGGDAGHARYLFTRFHPIAEVVLNPLDAPLLKHAVADGHVVEPEYFLPTYPLVLDGAIGIGTGYSTSIPAYNPLEVIANIKAFLQGQPLTEMHPWYRGYRGKIIPLPGKNKYITVGDYVRTGPDTIKIYELPVGAKNCKSFSQYKEFLITLLDETIAKDHVLEKPKKKTAAEKAAEKAEKDDDASSKSATFKSSVIKDFLVELETDIDFVVNIEFKEGVLDKELANNENYRFEKKLKLAYAFSATNMHMFTCDGIIKKFNSPQEILEEFMNVRLVHYERRRIYWINRYKFEHGKASAKLRFVTEVMDDVIDIRRKKRAVVDTMLETAVPHYPKYSTQVEDSENTDKVGYDYLLHMHIESYTEDTLDKLRKEAQRLFDLYTKLESQTNKDLWLEDLVDLQKEYLMYVKEWSERTGVKDVVPRVKVDIGKGVKPAPVAPLLKPKIIAKSKTGTLGAASTSASTLSKITIKIKSAPAPIVPGLVSSSDADANMEEDIPDDNSE